MDALTRDHHSHCEGSPSPKVVGRDGVRRQKQHAHPKSSPDTLGEKGLVILMRLNRR